MKNESVNTEYKRTSTDDFYKSMIAFANTSGGTTPFLMTGMPLFCAAPYFIGLRISFKTCKNTFHSKAVL